MFYDEKLYFPHQQTDHLSQLWLESFLIELVTVLPVIGYIITLGGPAFQGLKVIDARFKREICLVSQRVGIRIAF
jgi:hypothetical protein